MRNAPKHIKPTVAVSRCLNFDNCRYDGEKINCKLINDFSKYIKFVTVCPEVDMGMPTPRDKIRIVEHKKKINLYQRASGKYLTEDMKIFSDKFLSNIDHIDGFILKSRSPSCGIRDTKIYPDINSNKFSKKSSGLFAGIILKNQSHLAIEDEKRLLIIKYQEHFLTKLFAISRFKNMKKRFSHNNLTQFHAENRLLFLYYNINVTKMMDILLIKNIADIRYDYEKFFFKLFVTLPRNKNKIEKLISSYNNKESQTYFEPYPEELKKW